ncbi:hypothetical protein BBO99_00009696 [Phytophthora kernoviae]|uniref:RxLR effector protein n=1 Tax=Phytophthora kernoviae TaxID=325452 RepID=A0A3R7J227_9STRA|nr:hypothetical protein JM16_009688 [Phytophthora kernoviae]RLN11019.1 hypothetical protein BBI17_009621 [Phytophthora kernoviae]RLN72737.1 hypothetical protein BBO99_00009696 [Phytophthora kernoviae]
MRPSFVLLLALALFVTFSNAASATTRMTAVSNTDSNKRSLRAVQKEDDEEEEEEERGVKIDKLFAGIDLVKLNYRSAKDIATINKLKVAAAGNGAKAAKAEEKLKAMELKAAAAGNGAMSAKKTAKEARMFKGMLDNRVEPYQFYSVLGLDLLGNAAIHNNLYKVYQRIRLQTAKMDR